MGKKTVQQDWYFLSSQKKKNLGSTVIYTAQVIILCASFQMYERERDVTSSESIVSWILSVVLSNIRVPCGATSPEVDEQASYLMKRLEWFRMGAAHGPVGWLGDY